jgi:hypothetical protein
MYQNTITLTIAAMPAPTFTKLCLFTLLSCIYNIVPNPPSHRFHFPLLTLAVDLISRRSSSRLRSDLATPFSEKRVSPSWANQYLSHHFGLNFCDLLLSKFTLRTGFVTPSSSPTRHDTCRYLLIMTYNFTLLDTDQAIFSLVELCVHNR